MALTPSELVVANFNLPKELIEQLNKHKLPVIKGE